ncbi:hypothetical protein SMACR_04782 [Sordaria macrospora]|uniref:Uncharacterized protein n=1 Tax=Sordaria macrospora TaxID=5147 RepID=A0A8S9A6Y6_SORMA|nr:hypothetical protein SMACR_04782 [Sordaria macrospora]WPJ62055.1 hypothetical protein SMAC4_04782 [Sordaria macrospora]
MVVGRHRLLSLAVLSGLGVDAVRGVYHLPRNVTVSSIPEAHSQSAAVDPDEAHISPSSVGSAVEVTNASQTSTVLETQAVGVGAVNSLQPTAQDTSEPAISEPSIATVPASLDPSSVVTPETLLSTFTITVSPSSSGTGPSDEIKTSSFTSDYFSHIDEEGFTITTGPLPSSSDFTSSSSLAWNYAPVGQKSESLDQNEATTTARAVPGGNVVIPPEMPEWVEITASFPATDIYLDGPSVEIPVSWDHPTAITTSDYGPTQTNTFTSTRGQFWNQTTAPHHNQSSTLTTSKMLSSSTIGYCEPSDLTATATSWDVVPISTITWVGDPSNYTQPYPTLIPPPVETIAPCIVPVTKTAPPPGITLTTCFTVTVSGGSATKSCSVTVTTNSWGYGPQTSTTIRFAPTVTYITTDKNPAVVYSPMQTPDYGVTNDNTGSPRPTPVSVDPVNPPVYNTFHSDNSPGEVIKTVPKPVTVIVKPSEVVIGTSTIADKPATKTQTVVVGGETFTVGPTQIVGGGATVTRPSTTKGGAGAGAGAGGIIYAPVPTSTKLNDLSIIVSSSVAVIGTGSSTFTLPPKPTTVVVDDHTVSLGPSGIAIIDPKGNPIITTVTLPPPREQTITVGPGPNNEPKTTTVDGVPITIISSSVAIIGVGTSSSTIVFPPSGSSPTTITIDDGNGSGNGSHTLTVGPSGITLTAPLPPDAIATGFPITTTHTLSMPLPSLITSSGQPPPPTPSTPATEVVIAGGQLITAIGRSVVVIHGTTITYTTLSSPFTTVIDGQDTIVLDPSTGVLITHHLPATTAGTGAGGPVAVTTLGGPNADPSATEFAVVGGATITKVGASVVVVEGVTYTVGPSATITAGTITTVLSGSGQTVTIGPEGVVVGTVTIEYPVNGDGGGSTTVIFPGAGGGPAAVETASATAAGGGGGVAGGGGEGSAKDGDGNGDDDEDAGVSVQVMWRAMMLGLGVAGAVGVFGL